MGTRKLQIISKSDGHRRCGMPHVGTAVYPLDKFTAAERKALDADKLLVVQEIEVADDKPADKGKGK